MGLEKVPLARPSLGEREEELELRGRQLDGHRVNMHEVCGAVDHEGTNLNLVATTHCTRANSAKDCTDPQHELLWTEGLGEVVVGAECESLDAILLVTTSGEHEDRDVASCRVGAQLIEHVVAGRAGEHEIQHDERWSLLSRSDECIRPRRRGRDAIPRFHEVIGDEGDDIRFVVDDEDALAGAAVPVGRRHTAARALARRRWILATIISIAMALWPPRGTITSA